ncbi:MAG: CTP synthase, partial [Candidatus Competibacteraceae bacterium]|nr:CTP synthase [Candidatus Competibacteraceae bacterium]
SDREIPPEERRKIALFTNIEPRAVISVPDADTIYRIPLLLHAQGLDDIVARKLRLDDLPPARLTDWERVVNAIETAIGAVDIAMVGKYVDLTDAYKSLNEALLHAGIHTQTRVNIHYLDSERIEREGPVALERMDAILVPGGFGERGIEGKIAAVRFARERRIPYLGICLGMQVAVIEFARHVAGLAGAHSTEFRKDTPHPVIALITEWTDETGVLQQRQEGGDLGGTMRLGAQPCRLTPGSLVHAAYGKDVITERHRHRYEFNNRYREPLHAAGLALSGHSLDDRLVETIELPDHPWFFGCQFHPEFTSTPRAGHPLFRGFMEAAIRQRQQRRQEASAP